jgi:hypothetical protein
MSGAYEQWRLPDLLAMVDADSSTATTAHLQAWQDKYSLLLKQKQKLESLVAELSANWNPAKSDAAQTFVDTINTMIDTLDEAAKSVAQTWGGLSHITNAIGDVQTELLVLAKDYHDSGAAAHEFNKQAIPMLPDVLNPDHPVVSLFGMDALVMRQHQDRLDKRAREIMVSGDGRVTEATGMLQTIPNMQRIYPNGTYDPVPEPGNGSSGSSDGSGGSGGSFVPSMTFNPPPPSATALPVDLAVPGGDDTGAPILAGGPATTFPPATSLPTPPGGPLPPLGGGPVPGTPATGWLSKISGGSTAMRPGGVIGGEGLHPTRVTPRGGMPVNGVLGGVPGEAVGPRGNVPLSGGGVVRGQSSSGLARTDRSAPRSSSPHPGDQVNAPRTAGGGWHDRSFERYAERRSDNRQGDPDEWWEIEEGVPPVLEAPRPSSVHDAGAGVIGLDR